MYDGKDYTNMGLISVKAGSIQELDHFMASAFSASRIYGDNRNRMPQFEHGYIRYLTNENVVTTLLRGVESW